MSFILHEGEPSRDHTVIDRKRLVRGFETGVIDRLEGDQSAALFVGIGITLEFDRNPRTRRAQLSLTPDFDSQVGFRFDPWEVKV